MKLRTQLQDAWYLFVVPALAALLPWRLAWRGLRWIARHGGGPFAEGAQAAAVIAPEYLPIGDRQAFAAEARLIWLLDTCDLYLSLYHRQRGWRPWHVRQVGAWPTRGPFVALGSHHGTGHWLFRSLAEAGHDAIWISARWERREFAAVPLRYLYGRLRGRDVRRLSGRDLAIRPHVRERLAEALAAGDVVTGLIDVPPRLAPRGQRPVRLLDRAVSLPGGLLDLARDAGVPVVPYWIEFDLERGVRHFCIGEALDPADPDRTLQALADVLDRQIRRTPAAWFFWPEWPRWTADAPAALGAGPPQTPDATPVA